MLCLCLLMFTNLCSVSWDEVIGYMGALKNYSNDINSVSISI
jgi:hypothetical protein